MEKLKRIDVMIDLETLGTNPNSVFISLGAVAFDIGTGEVVQELYEVIDWQSSLDAGRVVDASTIKWWLAQSDEARKAVLAKGIPLVVILDTLSYTLIELKKRYEEVYIWGNGATFDISILEDAFRTALKFKNMPWEFWAIRDVRTIKDIGTTLCKVDKSIFKLAEDKAHNALEDARHQAQYVHKIWSIIGDKFNGQ